MKIDRNDPRWTAYVLDEMSPDEQAAFEQEMATDADAEETLAQIRETVGTLEESFASLGPVELNPEQRQEITAATATVRSPRFAGWGMAAGIAAVVLMGVATVATAPEWLGFGESAETTRIAAVIEPRIEAPSITAVSGEIDRIDPTSVEGGTMPPAETEVGSSQVTDLRRNVQAAGEANEQIAPLEGLAEGLLDGRYEFGLEAVDPRQTGQDGVDREDLSFPDTAEQPRNRAEADETFQDALANAALTKAEPEMFDGRRLMESSAIAASPGISGGTAGPTSAIEEARLGAPVGSYYRPDRNARPSRFNTEEYSRIVDNPFLTVARDPLATFSVDVDTASYANVRRFLNQGTLPPPDAVRIEEMVNYFDYDYAPPTDGRPVRVHAEVGSAPWQPEHRLVRIGIQGREVSLEERARANLVFLIDVSGSMNDRDKLPLLKDGMRMLVRNLGEDDRVAIVVYAGASGLVLPSTPGYRTRRILAALDQLSAGGSTNGGAGIQLAYDVAVANFVEGGVNRVILATDGDFNVGVTNNGELTRLIEEKAKTDVFLSVLGFGTGNYNDAGLEALADRGNGNYAYIDNIREARKVLVQEMDGTLVTIAKDVKFQVEFNPAEVNAYRLIGYENRILEDQDFNDDAKDAGEIGAGHSVTALFEVIPNGVRTNVPGVDPLRYQTATRPSDRAEGGEMLTVKIRYKDPDGDISRLMEAPLVDRGRGFESASADFRFASAVAGFGMILRDSPHKGSASFDAVIRLAESNRGEDREGYRDEFIDLVRRARAIEDFGR